MARWLAAEKVSAIYASPMRRARETADPLANALGLDVAIDPDFVEMDHLSATYVPLEQLKAEDYPRWQALIQQGGLYAGVDLKAFRSSVVGAVDRVARSRALPRPIHSRP